MEQEGKLRKVATYTTVNEQKTDDDYLLSFYVFYRETRYYIEAKLFDFRSIFEHYDFLELGEDICSGLNKRKYSSTLNHLFSEGAICISPSPLGKYDNYDELPPKARNKMRQSISYFLNAALGRYLDKYKDTPDRDDLWKLICHDMPNWSVRMLDDSTITYSKGQRTLTKATFNRQFNRKIGTRSFLNAELRELNEFYSEREKKPVGRPRKHPPKKTRKHENNNNQDT